MKGFSLIETMVVLGIIAIILSVLAPLYHMFQVQNDFSVAATTYAQALNRAALLSESMRGDAAWGVLIATSSVTLFKGATYALRDTTYDESYAFSSAFTVSGVKEVDFAKFTGKPTQTGTTTLSIAGFPSKSIFINAQGTVTY